MTNEEVYQYFASKTVEELRRIYNHELAMEALHRGGVRDWDWYDLSLEGVEFIDE